MTRRLAAALLLGAAGFASAPAAEAKVPDDGETGRKCDAAKARALVGKARSRTVGTKALHLSGARTLRWIPEGGIVTMDYREDRLSLHLDRRGRIVRIACG